MTHPNTELDKIRASMYRLNMAGLAELSRVTGVPVISLFKIRSGKTAKPSYERVVLIAHHVDAVTLSPGFQSKAYRAGTAQTQGPIEVSTVAMADAKRSEMAARASQRALEQARERAEAAVREAHTALGMATAAMLALQGKSESVGAKA